MAGRLIALACWIALTAFVGVLAANVLPACEADLGGWRLAYCPASQPVDPPRSSAPDPLDAQIAEVARLEREMLAKPICPATAPPPARNPPPARGR